MIRNTFATVTAVALLACGSICPANALFSSDDFEPYLSSVGRRNLIEDVALDILDGDDIDGRRLQDCMDLMDAMANQIPNVQQICSCSSTLAVTCNYNATCSMSGEICADNVDITIDVVSGVSVKYLSKFSDPPGFKDTSLEIKISQDGQRVTRCKRAEYDGNRCACSVCNDRTSVRIDCSEFERRAVTDGCMKIDLTRDELIPIVPEFMLVYVTPAPTNPPTMPPTNPPQRPPPSTTTNGGGSSSTSTTTTISTTAVSRPTPEVPADKSCNIYGLLAAQVDNPEEVCGCADANSVDCVFTEDCTARGVCANFVVVSMALAPGPMINYCTDFKDGQFEYTCVESEMGFDQTLTKCHSATYGGKQCKCEVCDDKLSMTIDCSEHDPFAKTDGCQGLPDDFGPVIPDFEPKPAGGTSTAVVPTGPPRVIRPTPEKPADTSCTIFGMLSAQVPEAKDDCGCSDGSNIRCVFTDFSSIDCSKDLCAHFVVVDMAMTTGIMVDYCAEYIDDYQYTCVQTEMGFDQTISACHGATYGGNPCKCEVCDDKLSMNIDCSAWDPFAKTDGCQGMPDEIGPMVPAFQKKPSTGVAAVPELIDEVLIVVDIPEDKSCALFGFIGDQVDGADEFCGCRDSSTVACYFVDDCTESGLCADAVEVLMQLTTAAQITYCTEYKVNFRFELTCAQIEVGFDQKIQSCKSATYGDKDCVCTVCDDNLSLAIDCSMHDPYATTNGCQSMPTDIGPVIPEFQIKPEATGVSTYVEEPPPVYEVPADKSCPVFGLLAAEINNAEETCGCQAQQSLACYFANYCEDGVCARLVTLILDLSAGINAEYCTDFAHRDFEDTCINADLSFDQKISSCNGATYGGKECKCTLCDDRVSIIIDCSEHNPLAVTDGCQSLPAEVGPVIPAFQVPKDGSTGGVPKDTSCPLFGIAEQNLDNAADVCGCDGLNVLLCEFEDVCNDGVCADVVDLKLDLTDGITAASCTDYIDIYGFEETCVDVALDFDQTISSCRSATYDGKACKCELCDDKLSLIIDCSEFNPRATTVGCQGIGEDVGPIIPAFQSDEILGFTPGESSCTLYGIIADRVDNADELCGCASDGSGKVMCRNQDICAGETCSDYVDVSIAVDGTEIQVENCATFFPGGHKRTCATVSVGMGSSSNGMNFEQCLGATYGGSPCVCRLCGDKESLDIDCSSHEPSAKTPGCQPLDSVQLEPFVPDFGPLGEDASRSGAFKNMKLEICLFTIMMALVTNFWF